MQRPPRTEGLRARKIAGQDGKKRGPTTRKNIQREENKPPVLSLPGSPVELGAESFYDFGRKETRLGDLVSGGHRCRCSYHRAVTHATASIGVAPKFNRTAEVQTRKYEAYNMAALTAQAALPEDAFK